MDYQVRNAEISDLPAVMTIYARARSFMIRHNNPDQWGTVYPAEELLRRDISENKLYVLTKAGSIHGVFYFAIEPDRTYAHIEQGTWHWDMPYGVIHRIAGDGSGGILKAAVAFARSRISYLRIDTHEDNYVMQKALEKQGFRRCGIIYIEDGTSRIAYDSKQGVREAMEGDLAQVMELYLHLHEREIPKDTQKTKKVWDQILRDPNYHLIVYEQNGRILSSCICAVIPNLTRNLRPYALIENVVTHEAHRQRGYGRACLNYAAWLAKGEDCYKLMLLTGARDEETLNFYSKSGYNSTDKTAFIRWLTE